MLYEQLLKREPSPVVALNHAVAVAMSGGYEYGLARINQSGATGDLDAYHLFHAARADLLRRMGCFSDAAACYRRALALTSNGAEQQYLRSRLESVEKNTQSSVGNRSRLNFS